MFPMNPDAHQEQLKRKSDLLLNRSRFLTGEYQFAVLTQKVTFVLFVKFVD